MDNIKEEIRNIFGRAEAREFERHAKSINEYENWEDYGYFNGDIRLFVIHSTKTEKMYMMSEHGGSAWELMNTHLEANVLE